MFVYIHVIYKSIVYAPRDQQCRSPEKIKINNTPKFIASQSSLDTSCGLHGSPWILEALPGQNIEMRLTDFSWQNGTFDLSACPFSYGYILDMASDDVINICGGTQKEKHLYQSTGNTIQIILERSTIEKHSFILQFKG